MNEWRRFCMGMCMAAALSAASVARGEPIFLHATRHHYEIVEGNFTWHQARQMATQRTFAGEQGYLATIRTVRESASVVDTFFHTGSSWMTWLGGYEPLADEVWIWADGPEAGVQFAQGEHLVAPFYFAPWAGIEPNGGGPNEDYLVANLGNSAGGVARGEWAAVTANFPVRGFLVEYSTGREVPEPAGAILAMVAWTVLLWRGRRGLRNWPTNKV